MVQEIYKENALPIADLEKVGLAKNGKITVDQDNLKALLSGKRTDMISLKELNSEGLKIDQLDAKLSVRPNKEGKLDLVIHPIYKEAIYPGFLTNAEAEKLEKGESPNFITEVTDPHGKKVEVMVEFDKDTKEFVVTEIEKVMVPDMVNNEKLTAEQKEKYRKGKEVELSDGTVFQMSNTDKKGIVSNKTALIVSLLLDGGVSFLLISAINALRNKKHNEKSNDYSLGYKQALKDLQNQEQKVKTELARAEAKFRQDNGLEKPADPNKKWVKVKTGNVLGQELNEKFILVDRDQVKGRDSISANEARKIEENRKFGENLATVKEPGQQANNSASQQNNNQNNRSYTRSGGSR